MMHPGHPPYLKSLHRTARLESLLDVPLGYSETLATPLEVETDWQ